MNGIEILSTAEVATATAPDWPAIGFVFGVMTLIATGLAIWIGVEKGSGIAGIQSFLLVFVVALWVSSLTAIATEHPTAYETHYKVTVDDNVSMNEFNEKYEIVSQEGKIYTIRERK